MTIGVDIGLLTGSLSGAINYPLINGFRPSWASAEFKFNVTGSGGPPNYSIQSCDYKITRTRKKTRGTAVDPLAKTRGTIDYTCKVKMLLAEWNALALQLAGLDPTGNNAYGDVFFTLHIAWSDPANVIIEDVIQGCTLDTAESSPSEGADDIVVESELNPLRILRNGLPMSSQPLGAPQI